MGKAKLQRKKIKRTPATATRAKPKPTTGTIKCAFCRGTGKDPFGCLSALSNCQVCGGTGEIHANQPVLPCVFCNGTGVQPNTTDRLHCLACRGTGVVPVIEDPVKCPACDGTGHQMKRTAKGKRPVRQRCLVCNGQRLIARARAAVMRKTKRRGMTQCAFCKGTGIQPDNTDNLSCLACGGTGEVPAIKNPAMCQDCDGTGRHTLKTARGKRRMRQHCLTCNGQGVVASSVSKV